MKYRLLKSCLPKMAPISGVTKSFTNAVDHRGEGGADDDRHRQVDDVAPQDEFLEVAQHRSAPFVALVSA